MRFITFLLLLIGLKANAALDIYPPWSSQIVSATSTAVTPSGTTQWHQGNGNSITLTTGNWLLMGYCNFSNGGSSPAYTDTACYWAGSNGANSATVPMDLRNLLGVNKIGGYAGTNMYYSMSSLGTWITPANTMTLSVTAASATASIYLVTWSQQTTSANARTSVHISATRLP